MNNSRFVLDTNVLVSALLIRNSTSAIALRKAETEGVVLYSKNTLAEIAKVLSRPKFHRYISAQNVEGLLARIHRAWEMVTITHQIRACRDPKDDMFLELAVNGQAQMIISGDNDLLALTPYHNIAIITPAQFTA